MNLTVRRRLTLAMGLLASIVIVIGVAAPVAVGRLRAAVRQAVQVDGQMALLASDVAEKAQAARRFDQSFFLHLEDLTRREEYRRRWETAAEQLEQGIGAFTAAATEAEDQQQARLWAGALSLYSEGFRQVAAAVEAGEVTSPTGADARLDTYRQNIETLVDLSSNFAAQKRAAADRSVATLDATGNQLNIVMGLTAILGIVIAVVWSLYFPAKLTRPLGLLSATAHKLAEGDLTARTGLHGGGEIGDLGQAFDQMAATVEQRTADLQAQFTAVEAARCEAETARVQVAEQLALIEAQRSTIAEMSVPILPVAARVLVMPVVGALDSERIAQAQERALRAVEHSRAAFLIVDITGVPVVDTQVAQGLVQIIHAAALLGARSVLVGIRPEVAQTMVGLGINLGEIETRATLEAGISYTAQFNQAGTSRKRIAA